MDFVLGVVSSMAASILLVILGYFGPISIRTWLVLLLSRLTGVGVERVYTTQKAANADIHKALADADWVKVFAGRGNALTDGLAAVWSDRAGKPKSIDIMLPQPDGKWLRHREDECARHDRGYGDGFLSEQVRGNLKYLQRQTLNAHDIDLRTCDFPQLCRIIATDQVVYLTPYVEHEHGRDSTCFVFHRSSPMYAFALRIFDSAWCEASPASPVSDKPSG